MNILRITQFCIAVFSFLLVSCTQSVDVEKVKKEIEEANSRQLKAFATKDLAGMTANYAADATFLPQNGPMVQGQKNIEAFFEEMASMMSEFNFSTTSFDVSGDLAYEIGTYTGVFGSVADKGKYATIWKKQTDGKWMIVVDIFNTSLAPTTSSMPETKQK